MTRTTPHPIDARIVRDQRRANAWRRALYQTRRARHDLGLPTPLTLIQASPTPSLYRAVDWTMAAALLALGAVPFFVIRAIFAHGAH